MFAPHCFVFSSSSGGCTSRMLEFCRLLLQKAQVVRAEEPQDRVPAFTPFLKRSLIREDWNNFFTQIVSAMNDNKKPTHVLKCPMLVSECKSLALQSQWRPCVLCWVTEQGLLWSNLLSRLLFTSSWWFSVFFFYIPRAYLLLRNCCEVH